MPVYKDEKRKTWYFKTRYKDRYGKAKQKLKRGFKAPREAKLAEAEFLTSIKDAFTDNVTLDEVFKHNMSVNEYAYNTIRRRNIEFNKHIQPFFRDIPLKKIDAQKSIDFKHYLDTNFTSSNSAKMVFTTFKVLINHAKKFFNYKDNPTLYTPKFKTDSKDYHFIKQNDFDEKVKHMMHKNYRELTILLFYTGLRVGEALALQWKNVHLEDNNLFVQYTLNILNDTINEPKTKASRNFVPYPMPILSMLKKLKKEAEIEYYGFNDDYFVFGGYKPYKYRTYYKQFKKFFPNLRVHDLRHSYASHLINKGIDIYLVKELMRHTNIQQTANTYGHLYNDRKQSAMSVFED